MCFTYKYSYVLTPNTTHNALWLLSLLLTLPSTNIYLHSTNIWISDKVVQVNTQLTLTASCSEKAQSPGEMCNSVSRHVCSAAAEAAAAACVLGSWLPPVFFCLIWSQEWLSKKERDSQCGRGWRCGLLFLAEEV